jgi:hypothetical protein
MSLSSRVVSRFLGAKKAPDPEFFLSSKFFKEKKAELRKRLKTPLGNSNSPEDVAYKVMTDLKTFFLEFQEDFNSIITFAPAREYINTRYKIMAENLMVAQKSAEMLTSVPTPAPGDIEGYLKWTIRIDIEYAFKDQVSTLLDYIKYYWRVDLPKRDSLVQKALKGITTPELIAAFKNGMAESFGDDADSKRRWEYLTQSGFTAASKKLLLKSPSGFGGWIMDWVDVVQKDLIEKFSAQAQEANPTPTVTDFDMYGMRVIIEDSKVTPDDTRLYIRYLDETYNRLRAKKLESAWYGVVFIQCESCGGVNQNGADLGVAGRYNIGKDVVMIYARPSEHIVGYMAHELGHRYWFHQLSSRQREFFESLVRVHKNKKPEKTRDPYIIPPEKIKKGKNQILDLLGAIAEPLGNMTDSKLGYQETLAKFGPPLEEAAKKHRDELSSVFTNTTWKRGTPEIEKLYWDAFAKSKALYVYFKAAPKLALKLTKYPDEEAKNTAFKAILAAWAKKGIALIDESMKTSFAFIDESIKDSNAKELQETNIELRTKAWEDEWDADPREVLPVSDYGRSNIGEAWAEVFRSYVMNWDMSRDQLETFKLILKRSSLVTAEQVLARFQLLGGDFSCTSPLM